jgi:hypothetical protein
MNKKLIEMLKEWQKTPCDKKCDECPFHKMIKKRYGYRIMCGILFDIVDNLD